MIKIEANTPCPCGSGKQFKQCCMDSASKQHAQIVEEAQQMLDLNPHLTMEELNVLMQHKMNERNNQPNPDFCGLSSHQVSNWLYAPFNELKDIKITTPHDVSASPVMRYLALMLDEAMQNDGSFKATIRGNLPAKLVKQASELLPQFAVAKYNTNISLSEFAGSNEDKFNALHYTRVLAEIAGIIHRKSGCYHVKKAAQKQYQTQGITTFFMPMLEAATSKFNWGYFDIWGDDIDMRLFWVFMLWRVQTHGSLDALVDEVCTAFPDVLHQYAPKQYTTRNEQFRACMECRFINRFLAYWGFATLDPRQFVNQQKISRKIEILPLLTETFEFLV
ncbi:MAG: SEC-C domain-containing protein [Pseudomonadales bacterium]|nr:SEC-C domain-containing protein [Pseudomonadales bacterium]